jgi:hypothetical protein
VLTASLHPILSILKVFSHYHLHFQVPRNQSQSLFKGDNIECQEIGQSDPITRFNFHRDCKVLGLTVPPPHSVHSRAGLWGKLQAADG